MGGGEIRLHVIFRGRVQGVSFRAYAKSFADSCGVKGWVKNLADGSVEAVFDGPAESVYRVIELCRTGNPLARVSSLTTEEIERSSELKCFSIE